MVKIIVIGCNGKMGKVVVNTVMQDPECEVVAGIDCKEEHNHNFPVYNNLSKIDVNGDVIIDFSHPSMLKSILDFCTKNLIPAVLCTTGYDDNDVQAIKEASKVVPIFSSRNMSIGINLLIELSKKAREFLGNGFDVEIIEKHHNQKIDAPSGTALMIADEISSVSLQDMQYVYDRHSYRAPRNNNEIGIHCIRGGNIVGDHEVVFAGNSEVITLSHHAQSKDVFAVGSVKAAKFIVNKSPRIYNMGDMI